MLNNQYALSDSSRVQYLRSRLRYTQQLALILLEFYHRDGDGHILDAALRLSYLELQLAIISHPEALPVTMISLAGALFARYELFHNLDSLEKSIVLYQKAIDHPELTSALRPDVESGLAYSIFHRFKALDREEDCHMSIELLNMAKDHLADADESCEARVRTIFTIVRTTIYAEWITPWPLDDMQDMVSLLGCAPRNLLPHSWHLMLLEAEARVHLTISLQKSRKENIVEGLKAARHALRLAGTNAQAARYHALAIIFHLHYVGKHFDSHFAHLDAALDTAQQMQMVRSSNIIAHCDSLACWSLAAINQSLQRKDLDLMEQSVAVIREAVSLCPQSHVLKMTLINDLAAALGVYFEQSGQVSILDELISLQYSYPKYVLRSGFFACNLAEATLLRAQIADESVARQLITQAMRLCQSRKRELRSDLDKRERGSLDLMIVKASQMQLRLGDQLSLDLKNILELTSQGLAAQFGPSMRSGFLLARSDALIAEARRGCDVTLLSEAEHLLEQELSSQSMVDSIFCVDLLAAKADVLVAQYDVQAKDDSILCRAWDLYHRATFVTNGRARQRFQASTRWATNAVARGFPSEALRAYTCAIQVLPRVVFFGEDVIGRIEALRQVNGLAGSSVSLALSQGNVSTAIDFLERTRGILWLQTSKSRATLHALPKELSSQFLCLNEELEKSDRLAWASRRHKAEELEECLSKIRQSPGFERFLLPPLLGEVEAALQSLGGYAVVVVPGTTSCDIVILGIPEGHRHLHLPNVDMERIQQLARAFAVVCSTSRMATAQTGVSRKIIRKWAHHSLGQSAMDDTGLLSELWASIAHPVIEGLNIKTKGCRKRLWWCPIGSLSSMPLHAAGIYEGSSQDWAGNYVISSYAPTLSTLYRLLIEAQTSYYTLSTASPRMLLAAQPESAGLPSLPNAQVEIELVRMIAPPGSLINDPQPEGLTTEEALAGVKEAHILHLACHGHQDQTNPLNSGFDLKDGRLTLGQLMGVNTPHAQLAYLSACESAGMDESRPDEGLNLASTMIFVGFKSVIATLWAMNDMDGPFMAERIYRRIFSNGKLDLGVVPLALDEAVRDLRESGVPASRWATYVHFGI